MQFWKKVLFCVLAVELLGNASGLVTALSMDGWYAALEKPPGTPPDGVFGPVWFVVYALMGVGLALIWHEPAETRVKRRALRWFGLQFGLNLLWTPVFFGLQRIELAFGIIVLLLLFIGLTIRATRAISRPAAGLFLPYLAWVGYATYLNLGFLLLN
ncbi:MAG: TspO/MBR family protein [Opitutales bacterium]